jgi:ribosomal-protein-alanine acetyltransferase
MSAKDAALLPWANTHVIPNGVDLARFQPEPESPGVRILFVGSFRHFPNVIGFQWLVEEVWPLMLERSPEARIVVVAGPDPWTHWREHTRKAVPELHPSIEVLPFVSDMRPLYRDANLVVVPTQVSAGTNLKVLEAMATRRALVSTASGVAGLGLRHAVHAWIANSADEFATAIALLLEHSHVRTQMAERAYSLLKDEYSWDVIGERQRHLFRTAIESRWPSKKVRPAAAKDLEAIDRIQRECPEAAQWPPYSYLPYRVLVAEMGRAVAGFIVCRQVADKEIEILNLAVAPQFRRRGVGTALLQESMKRWPGEYFLEVRESNLAAQQLYARLCFRPVGARPGYYENPPEAAVVMRLS